MSNPNSQFPTPKASTRRATLGVGSWDWELSFDSEAIVSTTAVFGEHEPNTLAQLQDVASRAARAALMADGHLGYVMPIGGVAAYREQVSVVGVGFDIACGNMAVQLDVPKAAIEDRVGAILGEVAANVSFGLGRTNAEKVEHDLFDSRESSESVRCEVAPSAHGRSVAPSFRS